jgi:cytochrome c oxidase subunit 3
MSSTADTQDVMSHSAEEGHHDHPAHLAHHFDSSEQQFSAGKLGMWLFLSTEILLFGGLFVAYSVYRGNHPEIFEFAHHFLDTKLGGINTVVLIASSFTMAMAVRASQQGKQFLLISCLILTLLGGCGFLCIKYVEYSHKIHHGLMWGKLYQPDEHILAEAGHGHGHGEGEGHVDAHGEDPSQDVGDTLLHGVGGLTVDAESPLIKTDETVQIQSSTPETIDAEGHAIGPVDHAPQPQVADATPEGQPAPASLEPAEGNVAAATLVANSASPESALAQSSTPNEATPAAAAQAGNLAANPVEVSLVPLAHEAPSGTVFTAPAAVHASLGAPPKNVHIFFGIYFLMTGLHGLHVIIGMGAIFWVLIKALKGTFSAAYFTPVDLVGLYWHLVDLIWIYLFPLLYLIH